MRHLRSLAWLVWICACAFLGYELALAATPKGDVRGGFLFASPMIALGMFALFGPWRFWARKEGEPADEQVTARVGELAAKLGVEPPKVRVGEEEWPGAVVFFEGEMHIYAGPWAKLSPSARDFVVAQRLAMHGVTPKRNWPLQSLVAIVGSAVACLNLWLILPLHSGLLLAASWLGHRSGRKVTLAADVAAVRATGDLGGAIRYLRGAGVAERYSVDIECRIRNLQATSAQASR